MRGNIGERLGSEFDTVYEWDKVRETFVCACLLHDVGHSPFSHTGEDFYEQSTVFEHEISQLVSSPVLDKDLGDNGYGKPHEAMSAIIGINLLRQLSLDTSIDVEFFSRAIMGIQYSANDIGSQVKNCLISILNGELIDVDKLDYLMRDAYVTGYSTMMIDYERLLSGYTIVKVANGKGGEVYKGAYKKGSLSIIENITYANDLERRWIQNNPTVLYDCKLVEQAILRYNDYMISKHRKNKKMGNIFNKNAISKDGIAVSKSERLRLLCDDDIIVYLKNIDDSIISQHYFSRDMRYKPLWKNEGDYIQKVKKGISARSMDSLLDNLRYSLKKFQMFFINETELQRLETERKGVDAEKQSTYSNSIYLVEAFKDFATEYGLDFQFAIIRVKSFTSNRDKFLQNPIYISVDENETTTFMELMYENERSVFWNTTEQAFFYVYTSEKNINKLQKTGKNITDLFVSYFNAHWE